MPASKKITRDVKARIIELFDEMHRKDPTVSAADVGKVIRAEQQARNTWLKRDYPNWPSDSAVRKILVPYRESAGQLDPQDRPWSIMAMPVDGVSPEDIPEVTQVWAYALLEGRPLSIREAKWVARLRHVGIGTVDILWRTASWFALEERIRSVLLQETPSHSIENMGWDWLNDVYVYMWATRNLERTTEVQNKVLATMSEADREAFRAELRRRTRPATSRAQKDAGEGLRA